jgi:thioredoxin-dependent peroxiredoxin
MISRQCPIACAVLLLMLIGVAAFAEIPQTGTPAPQFSLTSQEGVPVKLSDLRGKWVILYFYPKDFTSGCTLEAHNFQRDLAQYEKRNAAILGVSVDGVDSHKNFCTKEGLDFRLLADTEHKVSALYGSLGEYQGKAIAARNTFIINPDGKIAKVFEAVKPAAHSEEVLAALAQLQKK